MRRPPRTARGFTLVEVLVALMILAIMAAMAWQGVDGIVRAREASQRQLEQTLRLNTVLAQWQTDLAAVQDTGAVPPLLFDGATLRMTRGTPEGVQVVAWSLRQESNDNAWRRWASPAVTGSAALQDSWIASQQLQGGEPGQLRAVEGVSQWQVYFFQGNAWSNAQSTGNVVAAPAPAPAPGGVTLRQALPSGVRLVLSFAPGSGLAGTLTRDVMLGP
jgi:general secretion pathway protein J